MNRVLKKTSMLLGVLTLVSIHAHANAPTLLKANQTFLNDYKYGLEVAPLNAEILDQKSYITLRQAYFDEVRNYEYRSQYSLVTKEEEEAHTRQMRRFSDNIVSKVKDYQQKGYIDKASKFAQNDPYLRELAKPGGILAFVAGAYFGQEIKFKLGEQTRMSAKSKLKEKEGGMSLQSPVVNAGVDISGKAPETRDAFHTEPGERYSVNVNRSIPIVDVTSTVSYGSSSQTMNAALSRPIVANLTAVVDTTRQVKTRQSEQTARLLYGLSF